MGCNSSKHFDPEGPSPSSKGTQPSSSSPRRKKSNKKEKINPNAAFHADAPWINKDHKIFVKDDEAVAGGRIISKEVYSPPNFEHIPYPAHLKEQASRGPLSPPPPPPTVNVGKKSGGRI